MATAVKAVAGEPPPRAASVLPVVPVLRTVAEYRDVADAARSAGLRVGVVPTMGALHAGHRALIERAADECDVVVVTVFVNPTQFGEAADLDRYPRPFEADLEVSRAAGASHVFAPSDTEMYPGGLRSDTMPAALVELAGRLEGASRPGHFDGVATVVPKLLAPAGPSRAYFGEKDFQQLALVRMLVDGIGLPVEIVACETVREPDGVALSSRNVRLSAEERRAAVSLSRALRAGAEAMRDGDAQPMAVEVAMAACFAKEPLTAPDYAVLVRADTLESIERIEDGVPLRLLVAARVGPVRLIDNLDPCHPLPPTLTGRGVDR